MKDAREAQFLVSHMGKGGKLALYSGSGKSVDKGVEEGEVVERHHKEYGREVG